MPRIPFQLIDFRWDSNLFIISIGLSKLLASKLYIYSALTDLSGSDPNCASLPTNIHYIEDTK